MSERAPDVLILHGRRRPLISIPLEAYLRELSARPDLRLNSNGNNRGYIATWEVRPDDTLWLVALQTREFNDGPDPGLLRRLSRCDWTDRSSVGLATAAQPGWAKALSAVRQRLKLPE